MASLKILRPPLCSDEANKVPRQAWPTLIEERQRFCRDVLPSDCRMLLFFIEDGSAADWMGYGDRETYLRNGLHLDPEVADLAVQGLRLTSPEGAVGLDQAVVLSKQEIGIPGGKAGPGRGHKTVDNINRFKGGTSRDYILARLKRDHQSLAFAVLEGRMSHREAAIEAGFIKPPNPFQQILALLPKLSKEETQKLINAAVLALTAAPTRPNGKAAGHGPKEHAFKGTIWITNGTERKRIDAATPIPEGWVAGKGKQIQQRSENDD